MKKYLFLTAAVWLGFLSLPILESGCGTPPDQRVRTVQTLKIVGQSAKTSMDAATQLLKQGTITVPQWQRVADVYDKQFQPIYSAAIATAHANLDSPADPQLLGIAAQLAALVAELTTH